MQTNRFGVRRTAVPGCFEVFDRVTGVAVASGMRRDEAESDARRRNEDPSAPHSMTLHLGPPEVLALRDAVGAYMAQEGIGRRDHRILEELYALFSAWQQGHS
jgi:hypothetical protein